VCRRIVGRIDQIQGVVVLEAAKDTQRFEAMTAWAVRLAELQQLLTEKLH
jgi:hypothetical protein